MWHCTEIGGSFVLRIPDTAYGNSLGANRVCARVQKMGWDFTAWNVTALLACTLVLIIMAARLLQWTSDLLVYRKTNLF